MRTVDEKYSYNKKKQGKNKFSTGYCLGVTLYRDYPDSDAALKATTREFISDAKTNARAGDELYKGVMCGVRDAANERKSKGKR